MREVISSTEDVGERFLEEARRIHYGEAKERGIRGRASAEEADACSRRGSRWSRCPLPAALKETLQ